MKARKIMRTISIAMLAVAVVFVACALCSPTWGMVIRIGAFSFGPDQWRVCYAAYVLAMAGLFGASFFVKGEK